MCTCVCGLWCVLYSLVPRPHPQKRGRGDLGLGTRLCALELDTCLSINPESGCGTSENACMRLISSGPVLVKSLSSSRLFLVAMYYLNYPCLCMPGTSPILCLLLHTLIESSSALSSSQLFLVCTLKPRAISY